MLSSPPPASSVVGPLTIVHAEDDAVVPIADSEALAAAWPGGGGSARLVRAPRGAGHALRGVDVAALAAQAASVAGAAGGRAAARVAV